jgi:hypothetical protein
MSSFYEIFEDVVDDNDDDTKSEFNNIASIEDNNNI